ncbi:MAG: effector-associated domain EAD1-containing protein [Cyanobacteria bacterium P01_C01_bin.89]
MAWTSKDKKKLRWALLDAYRGYAPLKIFVADKLGIRLEAITSESAGLETVAFDLVDWAESKGKLDDLYEAFVEENPGKAIDVSGGGDRQESSVMRTINQEHSGSGDNVGGSKTVINNYYGSGDR